MTTRTDRKDPGGWGGLFCVCAFMRPVFACMGRRGDLFPRLAMACHVVVKRHNGLKDNNAINSKIIVDNFSFTYQFASVK